MARYTKEFKATQNTYIDKSLSNDRFIGTNTNYSGKTYLKVGSDDYETQAYTMFLGIDFSEIKYKKIIGAEMFINLTNTTDEYRSEVQEFTIEEAWDATKITARNHPTVSKNYWGDSDRFMRYSGNTYYMNITSSLQGSQRIGKMEYGYAISPHWAGTRYIDTVTSIQGGIAPYVKVVYEDSPPLKPTLYEPINVFINNGEPVKFKWKYNSEIPNDFQNGVQIQGKHELGSWLTIYNSTTLKNQEVEISGSTFDTGKWEWQLRTRNQFGEYSPWSEVVSFNALGLPKTPTVTVVQEGSRPIINWTATYQQVYQVQVLNSNNEIVHDSGSIASLSNKTYKVPVFLTNGNYTARVRIKNEFDLFSNWGTKAFTITTTPKEPFNIIIQSAGDFTHIRFNASGDYFLIYRRLYEEKEFKIVGQTNENSYKDYAIKGNARYVYFVRAVLAEEFTDSKQALVETYLKYPILASVNDLSKLLQIKSNFDEPLKRNYSLINEGDYLYFEGRQHPVKGINNFKRNSYSLTFFIRDQQLKFVEDLYNSNSVLLYRDNYKKIYCTIENGIDIRSTSIGGYSIQMNLIETDYKEEFND